MGHKFKFFLVIFCIQLSLTLDSAATVENSIIPLMDKFEQIENLPKHKITRNQFEEIYQALKQSQNKVRLVSYNMLFNIKDNTLDEVNRWPNRLPRIVELLTEMQPDIIGMQELHLDQVQDLSGQIGNIYSFYSKLTPDGEINGIYYRKDRFELIEANFWNFEDNPEALNQGLLTMVKLRDRLTNKVFAVFNTHLGFFDVDQRERQALALAEHLEIYAQRSPVFLTGDMNTFPARLDLEKLPFYDGDYIHKIFTRGCLKDSKDTSLLGHAGPLSTFTNTPGCGAPFQGDGTPGVFLDRIYLSPGTKVLMHAVQPCRVDGHYPSDHMPVLIDFIVD